MKRSKRVKLYIGKKYRKLRYKAYRISQWICGNELQWKLFTNPGAFRKYAKNRTQTKRIHSKWQKLKFLCELRVPGFHGLYFWDECKVIINLGGIYKHYCNTWREKLIKVMVHESLHHAIHVSGFHDSKKHELIVCDMGYGVAISEKKVKK